tara:strand:+ start:1196 stop:1654 length:459 start_codon:yes stop_codon:yes gene_type:complete
MKAKTFENLIRKVVREEIDYALRREIKTLKEDLRGELKPSIVEHTEKNIEIPEVAKHSLREKIMGVKPLSTKPENPVPFTKNASLNELLNETAMGNTNTESTMNTSTPMGGNPFNTPEVMPTEAMPTGVANVVNKDYRELVKVFNKKSNRFK